MKERTKAQVSVSIDELFELIRYNVEMANNYPSFSLDFRMASGKLAREHVKERMDRAQELRNILDSTWPK